MVYICKRLTYIFPNLGNYSIWSYIHLFSCLLRLSCISVSESPNLFIGLLVGFSGPSKDHLVSLANV